MIFVQRIYLFFLFFFLYFIIYIYIYIYKTKAFEAPTIFHIIIIFKKIISISQFTSSLFLNHHNYYKKNQLKKPISIFHDNIKPDTQNFCSPSPKPNSKRHSSFSLFLSLISLLYPFNL